MSTIVVVKKDGVAAIGADTLTMLGYTRESSEYIANKSKILRVQDNNIAYVGHASWGLVLASYFKRQEQIPPLTSPEEIFEAALDLHRSLKDEYFLRTEEDERDPFESSQFDCLIANSSGIFGLYSLRSVQQYTKFYAFGDGYRIALGAMHALYGSDFSAEEIATGGLEAACEFDDGTAKPIEVKTVRLDSQ